MSTYELQITFLTLLAVIVILYGLLIIVKPAWVDVLGSHLNAIMGVLDSKIYKRRKLWGSIFILIGVFILSKYFKLF